MSKVFLGTEAPISMGSAYLAGSVSFDTALKMTWRLKGILIRYVGHVRDRLTTDVFD